jgi:hypothetical protein
MRRRLRVVCHGLSQLSTKNIAEYTFVTIRAVQIRKNRLCKKFEIPSDADFNNWMRGLADTPD